MATTVNGKYANPTIQILVGDQAAPFHVHFAVLEKTAFFEAHGYPPVNQHAAAPPSTPATPASSPAPTEGTVIPDYIKEEDTETINQENDDAASTTPQATITPAYVLKGVIYEPDAFLVVVNYLYNEPPPIPNCRRDLRINRKAYVLAVQYRIGGLQDDLVNCFRSFHKRYTVQFDDLTWLARRLSHEEQSVCHIPMIQYLLEQCAFEVCKEGYERFAQQNAGFEPFLTHGDHPLRSELVKAMARIGMARDAMDPATGVNVWTVQNWREEEPANTATRATPDVISIDDDDD